MDRSTLKTLSLASAVAMTLGIPLDSSAAGYLKIGDIKGESQTKDHKEWINVLSWGWGLSTGDKGKTCVQDMQLTKYLDSATDDLAQSMPAGTIFPDAQLVLTAQSEAGSFEYSTYSMKNVKVTSLSSSGSDGGDIPTENISISFGELVGTYIKPGGGGTRQTFIIPASDCK